MIINEFETLIFIKINLFNGHNINQIAGNEYNYNEKWQNA